MQKYGYGYGCIMHRLIHGHVIVPCTAENTEWIDDENECVIVSCTTENTKRIDDENERMNEESK
jgi:hypothetical protein